jgi:hypothetical protein
MIARFWLGLPALLLILLVTPVDSVARTSTGTIVLTSGDTLKNIEFTVNPIFKVITFEENNKKESIGFYDIASILNDKGQDVTEEVLGQHLPEEWRFITRPPADTTTRPRHRWNLGISLAANYGIPFGDYYDFHQAGSGFEAAIKLPVSRRFALRSSFVSSGIDFDDDVALVPVDSRDESIVIGLKQSVQHYRIGIEDFVRPKWAADKAHVLYFFAELGAIRHKTTGLRLSADTASGEVASSGFAATDTRFAATLGTGYVIGLSPTFGMDFGVNLDLVWVKVYRVDDPSKTTHAVKGNSLDLTFGLIMFL